jgi:hypothetical protein
VFDSGKSEDHSAGSEVTTLGTRKTWTTVLAVLMDFANLPIPWGLLLLPKGRGGHAPEGTLSATSKIEERR